MYRTKVLPFLSVVIAAAALACNFVLQSGAMRRLQSRDVSVFPRRLGEWQGGADRPLEPAVQKQLANANVMDRIYTNPQGREVNLLIVSSTDPEDAHSPEACLPAQGWLPQSTRKEQIDGQMMHVDQMSLGASRLDVVFWWDILVDENANILSHVEALRESIRGQGTIMVRLTMPADSTSTQTLRDFARLVLPAMREWKRTAPTIKRG